MEKEFQKQLESKTNVDFMGPVSHFLGHKFQWNKYSHNNENHLRVHLSQSAYVDHLLDIAKLAPSSKSTITPYRSRKPVDSIPDTKIPIKEKEILKNTVRSMVGSLLWISQGTRPDMATITAMLSRYQNNPNQNHIEAARYAIRYLNNTRHLGIIFDSKQEMKLETYNQFPIEPLYAVTDANWGPQDQSTVKYKTTIPLFKSRSMSGHMIFLYGPLHWQSKRQTVTARSSAEAEIYATDECVRELIYLRKIYTGLGLRKQLFGKPTTIKNDNMTCVQWCKNRTTRTIRHIQLRDNVVREEVQRGRIKIEHIPGKENIADIFTKEDKDKQHFTTLRNKILYPPIKCNHMLVMPTKYIFTGFQSVRLEISQATGGVSTSSIST